VGKVKAVPWGIWKLVDQGKWLTVKVNKCKGDGAVILSVLGFIT